MSADMDRRQEWLQAEAAKVAKEIRDTTLDLCVRCVESLNEDDQGLALDPRTVAACADILRYLKAARPTQEPRP